MNFFAATAALGNAEHLDIPTLELLVKVESSGEDFYDAIADRVGNDAAAVLLRRNGREEVGHARRMLRALEIKAGPGYQPPAEILERFPVTLPDTIDASIFPLIVAGELQGDAGYQAWADQEPDPEVARLLRRNGREETRHADRIREVIAILEGVPA